MDDPKRQVRDILDSINTGPRKRDLKYRVDDEDAFLDPNGRFVLHEDYDALEADLEKARADLDELREAVKYCGSEEMLDGFLVTYRNAKKPGARDGY